ncbi:YdcF family protein [Arthrobacter sp. A5]|uniref:YdcF family protein n=1 Tax=Arthrobacter sp. A5 TaxID=576926 RepID=UPI003DA9E56E
MPVLRSPARRLAAGGLVVVVLLVLVWFLTAYQLFADPEQTQPHQADAVIMLGGASSERLPVARDLVEAGNAPVLAISHTRSAGNVLADGVCDYPGVIPFALECFEPATLDTRGEAAAIGNLVKEKGWHSVIVVTSRYHATRARTLITQCTTAKVQMIVSEPKLSPAGWLRRFIIESGGLIDARLHPACPEPVQ